MLSILGEDLLPGGLEVVIFRKGFLIKPRLDRLYIYLDEAAGGDDTAYIPVQRLPLHCKFQPLRHAL